MKKMTTEEFIKRAHDVHGDEYDYSMAVCAGVKIKTEIGCRRHGPFMQAPAQHLIGYGCPECAKEKRKATMLERHGVEYASQSADMQAKSRATREAKFGGMKPPGSGRKAMGTEEFVRRAREVHGDRYDYSRAEYVNNSTKLTIICPDHGPFEQTPSKHLKGHGCPRRECIDRKRAGTNLRRFGVPNAMQSDDVKATLAASNMESFGFPNPMQSPVVREQFRQDLQTKYGVDCTLQLESVKQKALSTKRKKGNFGASDAEERLYRMLCDRFGQDDIRRQYSSDRYPFACDFYIASRDLYVELNGNFTHGGHWYTGSDDDVAMVASFRERLVAGHAYYGGAIHVWTVDDVRKREAARAGSLNYIVFWGNTLTDADVWFAMGCPDGRDWDREYSWIPERTICGMASIVPDKWDSTELSLIAKQYQFLVFYEKEIAMWNTNPVYHNMPLRGFLYGNRYKYTGKLPTALTDLQLVRGFTIAGVSKGYTVFDSSAMDEVVRKYGIGSIYDPCAGWGERMLYCFHNGIRYDGYDVNASLAVGYGRMMSDFGMTEQVVSIRDASEAVPQCGHMDAVLTCPPYGDIEIYSPDGAENLDPDAFLYWWSRVVVNSLACSPEYFCFQVNRKYRDDMLRRVEAAGFELVDEIFCRKRSSHMTRGKDGTDRKKEFESMLVLKRI